MVRESEDEGENNESFRFTECAPEKVKVKGEIMIFLGLLNVRKQILGWGL